MLLGHNEAVARDNWADVSEEDKVISFEKNVIMRVLAKP
jgi:hypothetical protein